MKNIQEISHYCHGLTQEGLLTGTVRSPEHCDHQTLNLYPYRDLVRCPAASKGFAYFRRARQSTGILQLMDPSRGPFISLSEKNNLHLKTKSFETFIDPAH